MGVVLPQVRARCALVGEEPAGVVGVQVAHRRGAHDDVAAGLGVFEDEFAGHRGGSRLRRRKESAGFKNSRFHDWLRRSLRSIKKEKFNIILVTSIDQI